MPANAVHRRIDRNLVDEEQMARSSKYKPEYAVQAHKLCLLGAIDEELADFFNTTVRTIHRWKVLHQEFCHSLKRGKMIADAKVVERLHQRAIGFEHDAVDIRVVGKEIRKTPVRRIYPPDTVACIFWLKNRQLGKWRDKVEQNVKVTQRTLAEELATLNAQSGAPHPAMSRPEIAGN